MTHDSLVFGIVSALRASINSHRSPSTMMIADRGGSNSCAAQSQANCQERLRDQLSENA